MLGSSQVAAQLAASQEGLSSMELVMGYITSEEHAASIFRTENAGRSYLKVGPKFTEGGVRFPLPLELSDPPPTHTLSCGLFL
jgi:hypothetical protein